MKLRMTLQGFGSTEQEEKKRRRKEEVRFGRGDDDGDVGRRKRLF